MPIRLIDKLNAHDSLLDFVNAEGIPVYTDFHADLLNLRLGEWERIGARGAWVYLKGAAPLNAAYVLELSAGESTRPQHYVLDEMIVALDGHGYTEIWYDQGPKVRVDWGKWTTFKVPPNSNYVHHAESRARLLTVTQLPLIMNAMNDRQFLFNTRFSFEEFSSSMASGKYTDEPTMVESEGGAKWKGYVVRDISRLELPTGHKFFSQRGVGTKGIHVDSGPGLRTHVSEIPVATYKKAHMHGPSAQILIIKGEGYSLMWYGPIGWSQAEEKVRIDWKPGFLLVPPDRWWHQHFNVSGEPARYIAIHSPVGHIGEQTFTQIEYHEEDPAIRKIYEEELKRRGLESKMGPELYSGSLRH